MPVQTTYSGRAAAAYEGMVAFEEPSLTISRIVETAAGIGFGKPAFQGTRDEGIAASGSTFRGVTLADRNVAPRNGGDLFAQGDTAPVMINGTVWVVVSGAVAAGNPAYLTAAGAFTASATNNTPIPNARFDSSAASGGLARLRLN
ncbi:structural cement protein Gp24 [Methylobacterium sp. ID0610]|uniref:structural cement protein Gp24 n=1 Tax=Methylobacterium carpenticola TaxID=3344827 RepID=UPI00367C2936